MSLLTEVISNAHMAGQHHAGCAHPSWGDALGHTHTILPETLDKAARQHINEAEQTPTNTRMDEIAWLEKLLEMHHTGHDWLDAYERSKQFVIERIVQLRHAHTLGEMPVLKGRLL